MSAKTTSGPSKSRTTATPKRGRSSAARAAKAKAHESEPVTADVPVEKVAAPEKKTRVRRASKTETKAAVSTASRSRKKAAPEPVADNTEAVSEDLAPETKTVRRTRKTTESTPEAEAPAPRRRGRPRKSDVAVAKTPTGSTEETPDSPATTEKPAIKRRGRPRKAETAQVDSPAAPEAADEAVATPPKRRGQARKNDAAPVEADVVATVAPTEDAVQPEAKAVESTAPKRRGRPRKTAVASDTPETPAEPSSEETAEASLNRKASGHTASTTTDVDDTTPAPRKPRARKVSSRKADAAPVDGTVENTVEISVTEIPVAATETVTAEESTPADAGQPRFSELGLSAPIMQAIKELGYEHPTPIQAQAIPEILKGHDVLGVAQTGTGKTASFTLPMLEKLSGSRARARMPRSLILEPTRELALQVAENFKLYGKHLRLTHALLIGGESMTDQREVLNRGADVLIATPGRLLDLFGRGGLLLTQTSLLVIDEADRMLDMGFIPDIEKIVSLLPPYRQTLFFSATMAPEIRRLADAFLKHPVEITVSRPSSVATTIEERVVIVPADEKRRALKKLLRHEDVQNAIVFCNRKRDVDMLQRYLSKHSFSAGHLHGDLAQSLRFSTLDSFKNGDLKILVCSDVAARGIDIGGLSHVFNFDLPFNAEDYVHRIGRTGRAGKEGHAFSIAGPRDQKLLEAIEALTGKAIVRQDVPGIPSTDWEVREEDGKPVAPASTPAVASAPEAVDAEPTDEDDAPRRKRRRGGRRRNGRRDQDSQTVQPVSAESGVSSTPAQAEQNRPSVELAPAFENDAPKTGFGGDTPAFMLVPRRHRLTTAAENDRAGPIQHDGRHYGDQ